MQSLTIIVLSIAATVLYGIVLDQITVRVCLEYFTVGHPQVFETQSPTLLALGWGVIATWWFGLILGVILAATARAGRRPKLSIRSLYRGITLVFVVTATCALLGGLVGLGLAKAGKVFLLEPLASAVPQAKHPLFLADLWAHLASYLTALVSGMLLAVHTWKRRRKLQSVVPTGPETK